LFFFSIGATLELGVVKDIIVPAFILATIIISVKPLVYKFILKKSGESDEEAAEIGIRLGQASEFSLLIALLAAQAHLISQTASYLIQLSTILTIIVSSYLIVLRYPTPISLSDELRRD
jgi:Kef-type K+ transport system membrane component KefB